MTIKKKRTPKRRHRTPEPGARALFELRTSPIAGTGAFAIRPIGKGTRLIEYTGERISHEEADRRYDETDDTRPSHVVLFTVDHRTVVDAGVGGNEARFFNHSCDPNCESEVEDGHIYLDAIRDIAPGEELTYDYALTRESEDDEEEERQYPCHCGAPHCRGTLLEPRKRKRPARRRLRGTAARRAAGTASGRRA
jgi:SET domain-containing protein